MKVLGTIEVVLSVDDKADKDDSKNDTKEEDIVDDEDYKEKEGGQVNK
jgi:hypothetical protein